MLEIFMLIMLLAFALMLSPLLFLGSLIRKIEEKENRIAILIHQNPSKISSLELAFDPDCGCYLNITDHFETTSVSENSNFGTIQLFDRLKLLSPKSKSVEPNSNLVFIKHFNKHIKNKITELTECCLNGSCSWISIEFKFNQQRKLVSSRMNPIESVRYFEFLKSECPNVKYSVSSDLIAYKKKFD